MGAMHTLDYRWSRAVSECELLTLGGMAQECCRAGAFIAARTRERCDRCGWRTLRVRALVSRLDGGGAVLHATAWCAACGVGYGVTGYQHANLVEWRVDKHPLTLCERTADMVRHADRLGHAAVTGSTPCLRCGGTYTVALHRAGLASLYGTLRCERCGRHVDAGCALTGGGLVWLAWLPAAGAEVAER